MEDLVDSDYDVVDEKVKRKEGRLKKKGRAKPIEYANEEEEEVKEVPSKKISKKQYSEDGEEDKDR